MHIVDGVLSPEVLAVGAVITACGTLWGLRTLNSEGLPKTALFCSVFFIASLVHIPFGVTSVHFIGNGLMGLILGPAVFPALLIALFLQSIFFGFGGFLVLGVNTVNTAIPAIVAYFFFLPLLRRQNMLSGFVVGAMAGALSILLSSLMVAGSLMVSNQAFYDGAKVAVFSHLPLMVVEALLTGSAVSLLQKVKPEIFFEKPRSYQNSSVTQAAS
ncbi:MAG: cobalt transporter CbiM [Cellvibrionales bacterium]|nr:cobalt transporter CbiM [Cellvibrionales bacterium]